MFFAKRGRIKTVKKTLFKAGSQGFGRKRVLEPCGEEC